MSASILDSGGFTHQFKLNYLETEKVAIGHFVSSPAISAGGHLWRINCYPRGHSSKDKGDYVSIFLKLVSKSEDNVQAIFEASVMHRDGALSLLNSERLVHVYPSKCDTKSNSRGWSRFVERSILESLYVTNGSFIIVGAVKVIRDDSLDVPPSNIGSHLGLLLDSMDGSDVLFIVDGEKFPAHRAVLAARSPVFKSLLLGSMAEANMSSIILHDISPATFRVMLWFIYTDGCAEYDDDDFDELGDGDSPDDIFRHLLAAADRFALDRLKIYCAGMLRDNMSVDTVVETLICAERYNCPQLKKKCIDFIAEEKNFKKVALTDGYIQLGQQFPSILDELRVKVRA